MKKINLSFLILISFFLINCETTDIQEDTKPIDTRGCAFDEQNCDDDDGPGNPPGGGGTGTASTPDEYLKLYTKGLSSNSINLGKAQNSFYWSENGALPSAHQTHYSPAAAFFNNTEYVFHVSPSSKLIQVSYRDGANWVHNLELGNGAKSGSNLESIVFGGKIFLAYSGANTDNIYITSSSDGLQWSTEVIAVQYREPSPTSSFHVTTDEYAVGMVEYNNQLLLFYDSGHLYKTSPDGITWSELSTTGIDWPGSGGVSAAVLNNEVYIAVAQSHRVPSSTVDLLVQKVLPTVGPSQVPLQANTRRNVRPSLVSTGSELVMCYRGASDEHIFYSYTDNGVSWQGNLWAVGASKDSPFLLYFEN